MSRWVEPRTLSIALLLAIIGVHEATSSVLFPPVLDPKSYRSASEEFELHVDPSEPDGSGSASYRLRRDGVVVWEGIKPYTFFDAVVANDGTVAGVGYSCGLMGCGYEKGDGDLRFAVLEPTGALRFENVMSRKWSGIVHGNPVPQSQGVVLDEKSGRILLRLSRKGLGNEEWRFHDLRTGETMETLDPNALLNGEEGLFLDDVRSLEKGSLFLVHWEGTRLSRFMIFGPDMRRLWTHDEEGEPGGGRHRVATIASVTAEGFILELETASELLDYAVKQGSERLEVTEVDRRPSPMPASLQDRAPKVDLPYLGRIRLGEDAGTRNPIRNVGEFDIDAEGHMGFVRCEPGRRTLVVAGPSGEVAAELDVDLPEAGDSYSCPLTGWLVEDVWVVAAPYSNGQRLRLWAIELGSGRQRLFKEMAGSSVAVLRGIPGGISLLHGDELLVLNHDGVEAARIENNYNDERLLFSPEDVAALPEGGVAVLDNIRNTIQIFNSAGGYVETLDLEAASLRELSYPSSIAVAPNGAIAVWDFGSPTPLLRLSSTGALLGAYVPRYENGRPTGALRSLRFDSDGSLWATDGEALLKLNQGGVVVDVVGRAPEESRLTEVAATARDAVGRFYLADRRTASVHVFDVSGRFSHRCDPAPGDFDSGLSHPQLTVSGDGTVYLSSERNEYVVFDAEGHRIEKRPNAIDTISEDWYALPGSVDLWVTTLDELYLTDPVRGALHRIRRHGDGTWLDSIGQASVSSSGAVALLTGSTDQTLDAGAKLGVFTLDGDSALTQEYPALDRFSSIAFEDGVIVLGLDDRLVILDGGGEPLGQFIPEIDYQRQRFKHFVTENGRELQLLDLSNRIVYRYDLVGLR